MKTFIFVCLFIFQGCVVSKPKVENMSFSAASFSHTKFLNSCIACHEVKRPAPVGLVAHGAGGDCVSCHTPGTWKFNHVQNPASCVSCHETQRPSTTKHLNSSNAIITSNTHYNSEDCVKCHLANSGLVVPSAWSFRHTPKQASCVACHEIKRPAAPHIATGDCASCHTISNWVTTSAFDHNPKPTSCVSCHEVKRPTVSLHMNTSGAIVTTAAHYTAQDCVKCHMPGVWTFAHTPAQTSCVACHEVKRPAAPHTTTGDCFGCHTIANWSPTAFDHNPAPTSCLSCHKKDRPTVNTGHNTKSKGHYSSLQECKSCHLTTQNSPTTTWKSGSSKTCILCHLTKGINEHGSSANTGGSHSNCASCHSPTKSSW